MMSSFSRKQKITIAMLLIFSIFFIFLLFTFKNGGQEIKTEPEKGGTPTVMIVDEGQVFYGSVTKTDYLAVKARLTDYVVSQKGDPWTKVKITNTRAVSGNPTAIAFDATIDSLNQKELKVEFDYAAKPYPTFTIKEKGFSVPLYGGQD